MANQGNFLEWSFTRRRVLIEARASLTSTSYAFYIYCNEGMVSFGQMRGSTQMSSKIAS